MDTRNCACEPGCPVAYGTCHCACGEKTTIASQTQRTLGHVRGEPVRFVKGHAGRNAVHQLTEINETARTAMCAFCKGKVTIKSRGPAGRDGQPRWRCTRTLVIQHRLSKINELKQTAFCRGCDEVVPITRNAQRAKGSSGTGWICGVKRKDDAFDYREENRTEIQEKNKAWRDANRDRIRGYQIQALYGIPLTLYLREVEKRNGRCDICGEAPDGENSNMRSLSVDHDHGTGEIRGYLDADCNAGLGRFHDDPVRLAQAIVYLKPTLEQAAEITRILYRYRSEAELSAL